MAEIKNSFLRSKMNKDLDDRLIPNGEYRDAQNISVGKSEDDDIGALENVLGNTLIPPSSLGITDLQIIGYITDEYKDNVIVFATNYTDGTTFDSFPTKAPSTKRCIIYIWSPNTAGGITTLIDDSFLNFSTTNPIQATLIEELLFFTDNRNQPRKISIDRGAGYYTSEDQISVAKYNPWEPISLVKKETGIVAAAPAPTSTVFTLKTVNANIKVGMSVVSASKTNIQKIEGDDFITVTNVNGAIITLSGAPAAPANNPAADDNFIFLSSTMTNKSAENNWPGDPDFLEDKFVRFSYRFRFDDGEYSIMAPFTQIAYIPKQKGYFINDNEDAAYRSTILDWMENNVDNVELLIPLPDLASNMDTSYKITDMDVLYKESDALIVKVLETLPVADIIKSSSQNICSYDYQSRKPYKTLTQAQTVRVYDKVPVRALSQETAGNRIIYGNFRDIYTPPITVDYTVRTTIKKTFTSDSWVEYPNHSLKQNRSYQVGFVLCDKFGRQSSVILSPVKTTSLTGDLGSTIFAPYYTEAGRPNVKDWFGDALQIAVNKPITSNDPSSQPNFNTGEPGLYAIRTSPTGKGFQISDAANEDATIVGNVYTFKLDAAAGVNNVIPVVNNFLRGEFTDYVKVSTITNVGTVYTVTTVGQVNSSYLNNFANDPDIKYAFIINPTGWYSYKVVVKQTEQDYYNVYLPGILKGYPQIKQSGTPVPFPNDPIGSTSNIVLINDNINKVPRDLSEVGPDQKQFRSSVQLFGRVQNTIVGTAANAALNNIQYYPGTDTDTAISIATTNDSNMDFENLSAIGQQNIYQIDSKPLIARLATSTGIGVVTNATANLNMQPFLAIYETEPVESLLDIFWETTTVGIISDLNADVDTGFEGPSAISFNFTSFQENVSPGSNITDLVYVTSQEGVSFDGASAATTLTLNSFSVTDGTGASATSKFFLFQNTTAGSADYMKFQIKSMSASLDSSQSDTFFKFINNSSVNDSYTFNITVTDGAAIPNTNTLTFQGNLNNNIPVFTPALALITATVDETILRPLPAADQGRLIAFNGTNANNSLANRTDQLEWTITAGNPTNTLNGQVAFQINATTGQLTQTPNNTANGLYTLTITLKDSVSSGVQGTGGETIVANQQIRIGPTPVNSGVESVCKTIVFDPTAQFPDQATVTPYQSVGGTVTAVWYLSDNTSTGTARATYLEGTGWPTGAVPTNVTTGSISYAAYTNTNTIHRLGKALTQGTVALSMSMQLKYTGGETPNSGISAKIKGGWRVYHRVNNSAAWVSISDINNHTIPVAGIRRNSTEGPRLVAPSVSGTNFNYLQYVMAYDTPGEYLIVASETEAVQAASASQSLVTYCSSSDLNYSRCVIENGQNVSPVATTYKYKISNNSSAAPSCSIGSYGAAYSNLPYGQYVNQLFQSTSLSVPMSFTTDATDANGITHTNYKTFGIDQASPYNDGSSYKYTFNSRFTTNAGSEAKVYNPPSWGTNCFVNNCGNASTSTSQCNPLALTFPYTLNTFTNG